MTIKRTRPDRSIAMKGKPPLNPKGRPQFRIEIIDISDTEALLYYGDKKIQGDKDLIKRCHKELIRNRKK